MSMDYSSLTVGRSELQICQREKVTRTMGDRNITLATIRELSKVCIDSVAEDFKYIDGDERDSLNLAIRRVKNNSYIEIVEDTQNHDRPSGLCRLVWIKVIFGKTIIDYEEKKEELLAAISAGTVDARIIVHVSKSAFEAMRHYQLELEAKERERKEREERDSYPQPITESQRQYFKILEKPVWTPPPSSYSNWEYLEKKPLKPYSEIDNLPHYTLQKKEDSDLEYHGHNKQINVDRGCCTLF